MKVDYWMQYLWRHLKSACKAAERRQYENRYIGIFQWKIIRLWLNLVQWLVMKMIWPKFNFLNLRHKIRGNTETHINRTKNLKIQYGGWTPYWKYILGYNCTTICPICAKFCTKLQHLTTVTAEYQKFRILKFKMADGFAQRSYRSRWYSQLLGTVTYRFDYRDDTLVTVTATIQSTFCRELRQLGKMAIDCRLVTNEVRTTTHCLARITGHCFANVGSPLYDQPSDVLRLSATAQTQQL